MTNLPFTSLAHDRTYDVYFYRAMTRRAGWRAVACAVVITALGGMPIWLLSAFAGNLGHDLGFDDAGLGLIIGSFFAVSAALSLPSGRVVAAVGWKAGTVLAGLAAAVCMLAVAGVAFSWLALALLLAIGAIANSASQPAANLAIASAVSAERHGLAFGVKQAALPLATLLVGISVPFFDRGSDWRWAFLGAALVALGLVLLLGLSGPLPRAPTQSLRHAATSSRAEKGSAPLARSLHFLAVGAGLGTAATMSLGGFLVLYAVDRGLSLAEAGQLLAVGSAAGIVSRVLSGYLADRRGRRHEAVVAGMMIVGSVGLGVISLADEVGSLMAGAVLAYGLGWAWNGVFHLAVVRQHPASPAVATGAVQTAMSLGAMIGPPLFGFTAAVSYPLAWQGCAIVMASGAVFVVVGGRGTRPVMGRSR